MAEKKLRGFHIVERDGREKEVLTSTDKPFEWFPELKTFFNNFNCKSMEFEVDLENQPEPYLAVSDPDVQRAWFVIK